MDTEPLQEEQAGAKAEAEKLRLVLGWVMEPPATWWCRRTVTPEWVSKPTWDTARRPVVRSALP